MKQAFFVFISLMLFLSNVSLAASQPTKQETHGDNSPIANTQKGNICITINEADKIREMIQDIFNNCDNAQSLELKKRLAEIHKTELKTLPEEADKWADEFIQTLPLRKDKVLSQEEEQNKRLTQQTKDIPLLFEYTIKKFDAQILALRNKLDNKIELKQEDFKGMIAYGDEITVVNNPIRVVTFPNGTKLLLSVSKGRIKDNRFVQYPGIDINEIKNGQDKRIFSMVHVCYGYCTVFTYNDGELNDRMKSELSRIFDGIIGQAYLGSAK